MSTAAVAKTGSSRHGLKVDHNVESSKPLSSEPQARWAEQTIGQRLTVLKAARHRMAAMTGEFAEAISPELGRAPGDTLVAELLPLLAAGRFLEQQAEKILRPRRLGIRGRPAWLIGVNTEVHRVPYGCVLVIGPANYPLLLPGVQTLQGLAAGNAVIWKPGLHGRPIADLFADAMYASGLPRDLLRITDESVEAAEREIARGVAKVFFTGSADSGRLLMRRLADTLTPCVAELSGCDAVIVLPSARLERVVQALAFGMRFNQSATCMAPRRVLLIDASEGRRREFAAMLQEQLSHIEVKLPQSVKSQAHDLLEEARSAGATILGGLDDQPSRPKIIMNGSADMRIAQADIFAPILIVIDVDGEKGAIAAQETGPFGLTSSVFGEERAARRLASKLDTGTVTVNDLIVPTADPRVPFGGRKLSGFGVTRGSEGLLEMTAAKTVAVRRGRSIKHYEPTGFAHQKLFRGFILASHAAAWRERWQGVREVIAAGRELRKK